jgi:hypothetical protein
VIFALLPLGLLKTDESGFAAVDEAGIRSCQPADPVACAGALTGYYTKILVAATAHSVALNVACIAILLQCIIVIVVILKCC